MNRSSVTACHSGLHLHPATGGWYAVRILSNGEEAVNIELALLADYAAVTKEGKLVAAGIFDLLTPPTLPWQHPTMFVALQVHFHPGEDGSHKIKLRLVNPDGAEIVALDADVNVGAGDPVEGSKMQLVLSLNNIPFQVNGRHAFDVFLDGRYEHTVPLRVIRKPASADTPAEG
jgi:hypothetical protein